MDNYYKAKNPGSYGGVARLKRSTPTSSVRSVKKFLSSQKAYTLHKPIIRKFPRRKTIVAGIDSLWQADLADFQSLSRYNSGHRYMLFVIDVFSKYLWVEPLKTKRSADILEAFETVLKRSSPRMPQKVMTDKGTEFARLKTYLKYSNITYYTSENVETKASVAERVIRTIKERLYRYFTYSQGYRYLDTIQDIVYSYNRSIHRSIGMAPDNVNDTNEQLVKGRIYGSLSVQRRIRPKFKVGNRVRISKYKNTFEKGYKANWTKEIFTVSKKLRTRPPVYEIKDDLGEVILGRFYEQELQLVEV